MKSNKHPLAGLCYVLSEAFYHMHPEFKLKPMVARHRGLTHWWLQSDNGTVIDTTSEQFDKPFPYHLGRGCGFLTKQASQSNYGYTHETEVLLCLPRATDCTMP